MNNTRPFDTKGTTIIAIRKGKEGVIAGDGQVTLGSHIIKGTAKKVRSLGNGVIAGFAGSTADALTLLDRLSITLSKTASLQQACIEMSRDWRTDKYLRRLEAMMLVMDKSSLFLLSGNGDVIEPEGGIAAIGSGGIIALTAARAYYEFVDSASEIAMKSLGLAAEYCIYTNDQFNKLSIEIE